MQKHSISLNFLIFVSVGLFAFLDDTHAAKAISGHFSESVVETRSFERDSFYQLSPDGSKVVYGGISDAEVSEFGFSIQLYSVDIDGSNPRKLTAANREGRVFEFRISENSETVVFSAQAGLFSVNLSGDKPPVLIDNPSSGPRAERFILSSDSKYVVFDNIGDVFSVPIAGGPIELLSDTEYPSQSDIGNYRLTDDNLTVVFSRQEWFDHSPPTLHILSTPVQGGALTELLPIDMGPQDSFREVIASGNMLYLSAADGGLQLFSVAIGGGEQIALSDKYSFDVDLFFAFSPDGKTVMYEVRDVSAPRDSITFIVPVLGGESVQIDQGLSSTSKSCGTEFTPDSSKLIFCRADSATSDGRLSIADIASPTSRARLNNGQIVAGTSRGFRVTPDGKWLLVSSIEAIAAVFDHRLVRVPTSPGLKQQVFSFRSSSSRRICNGIDYSLDSSIISYCDIAPETGRARVIAQSTEQGEPRVLDPNPLGIGVIFHTISRDGEKVVILKDLESQGFQLFSAPTSLFEGQICLPIATKKGSFSVVCL